MYALLPWSSPEATLLFLLSGILGLLLLGSVGGCASEGAESEGPLVFVGTGSGEPDEGIYTFRFDPASGALNQTQEVTPILDPTYLTLSPDGRHLYSVNRTTDSATVSAFTVDPSTGDLSLMNSVSAEGEGPCYISMDATGQWLLTANYGDGTVAVFPVQDDGAVGPASQVVQHTGSGADPERQTGPHAHYFRVDPQNRHALASDLGIDEVRVYPFDADRGRLDTANVRAVSTSPGTGPRHLAFHPSGEYVYLIGELSGTITVYDYDTETGEMTEAQTVSTVPDDFDGSARSADIHVHPSGDFLYASNRGDANDIVHYTIDQATGQLSVAGRQQESIRWPRNFAIDPSGEYLLVANRHADNITVFRVDPDTGALTSTGQTADVPSPTKVAFAASGAE